MVKTFFLCVSMQRDILCLISYASVVILSTAKNAQLTF